MSVKIKPMLTIALILCSLTHQPAQVIAQTPQNATIKQPVQPSKKPQQTPSPARIVFVPPKIPPRLSTISGRRGGMGSRNNCPAVEPALTALVPLQAQNSKQKNTSDAGNVGGLTTSERPTFWFYVPYTQNLTASAEFIVQDMESKDVYRGAIALPPKAGVIGVSIPSNIAPLQVEQTYHWYFKVRCTEQKTATVPIYVKGYIHRVNLDAGVMQQLQSSVDPRQKMAIFAQLGIWFDALTMLAQLRLTNPNDASTANDWQSFLQSVQLERFAKAPVLTSPSLSVNQTF
ncbi:DUF928 domain-containing protein [Iningainema tapete]|uniref:DUF928 domain-containing protein n=1 Tax=Iningainema tapete BLCC-T55 TaxID=2748662 RepID=A0A8J6XDV8_9CYAN|nr:DUF928 domain-containing protein [Iningainema tapete]MBD2771818.1 DUF928 domain-containing protein [Iningainema tapete BLCC-T55]